MSEEVTPRVFVLEHCDLPLAPAEKFGEIAYLFPPGTRVSMWHKEFVPLAVSQLAAAGFRPDVDLFAMTGHIVPLVLTAIAAIGAYGSVRFLLFDKQSGKYKLREVELPCKTNSLP